MNRGYSGKENNIFSAFSKAKYLGKFEVRADYVCKLRRKPGRHFGEIYENIFYFFIIYLVQLYCIVLADDSCVLKFPFKVTLHSFTNLSRRTTFTECTGNTG